MPIYENSRYDPWEALAGPHFQWHGNLSLHSYGQDVGAMCDDIAASAITMLDMPTDIERVAVEPAGIESIDFGAMLEAPSKVWAMIKLSGLGLLAARKAQVHIGEMALIKAHLATEADLSLAPALHDHRHPSYLVGHDLHYVFADMQNRMIRYGRPATY